jgi:hypothetical protein
MRVKMYSNGWYNVSVGVLYVLAFLYDLDIYSLETQRIS